VAEHQRDHSLYIAFAPRDNPRVALAAIVENAGWGGRRRPDRPARAGLPAGRPVPQRGRHRPGARGQVQRTAGGHAAPGGGCAAAQPDPGGPAAGAGGPCRPPAAHPPRPPPRLGRRLRHGAPCRRRAAAGSAPVRTAAPGASR
jgi:penicillin-binding protein 2